jgi:hypothetical protein
MPRHRSLNLKKFIDSIPESLIEEYFKQRVGGGASFPQRRRWRQWTSKAQLLSPYSSTSSRDYDFVLHLGNGRLPLY